MSWRWVTTVAATSIGLIGTVVAAIAAVTAGTADGALAWTALGTSLVAAIGAYLIMRSRGKEEYREHWRSHGH